MPYNFRDKSTAERCVKFFKQNPAGPGVSDLPKGTGAGALYLVEIPEDMDGHGTELDDVQFPESTVEVIRTTLNPQQLLSETSETFHAIQAAPLEPTNYPAEAHVVAITDSFNQTFLVTPTPSEVFGTMLGPISDSTGRYQINLDQGFTVNGKNWVGAYPAPTLEETPESGAPVTCRYIKSVGKWFFFKPTGGGTKTLSVSGGPLAVQCATVSQPVFYTEMAAGETVLGLSILGGSQQQNATGSDTANVWVQFPTTFTTEDESVYWWKKDNGLTPGITAYYQTGGAGSYSIAPVAYYGKVISDGTYYYLPYYRTINGERYWYCSTTGDYIYYTSQDGVSGWAIGQTLGKFLTSSDPEIFSASTSISDLMTQEGLTYAKPAWTSSAQFGIYSANADAQSLFPSVPSIQFGCGRWSFPDGADPYYGGPSYFTHVCDGTAKQWNGTYRVKAFNYYAFSGINYISENGESYYYLGDRTANQGFYKSTSAPSTSASATFSYTPGTHPLKGTLSLTSSIEGTETWTMTLTTGAVAVYTCATGATSMTFNSITSGDYYFRTISQQGNYWVAVGVDGTVGNLIFDGATLSKEAGNDFIFDHDITLTFDQYVQGTEKRKVWVCSPGVIS